MSSRRPTGSSGKSGNFRRLNVGRQSEFAKKTVVRSSLHLSPSKTKDLNNMTEPEIFQTAFPCLKDVQKVVTPSWGISQSQNLSLPSWIKKEESELTPDELSEKTRVYGLLYSLLDVVRHPCIHIKNRVTSIIHPKLTQHQLDLEKEYGV